MLDICKHHFEYLEKHNIRYCHWKSNEHLDAAVNGKTDLDVLIHQDDKAAFEESLSKFEYKEILSPPSKQFPGLADYLGFDKETGTFTHLHVHYRLVMGQKYIKNHWLPLEDLFFDNLIIKDGVYIPRPEIELILLVIRAHVKTDMVSLLKQAIKNTYTDLYTAFPTDIEDEFKHLIATSNMKEVQRLLLETKLPLDFARFTQFFDRISNKKLRFNHIFTLQAYILKALKPYRRATGPSVYFSYAIFFINSLQIVSRFKKHKKKTLIGDGKIFSIVGADGSGKSTLSKEIAKWLSWKMTTNKYYYGIPKTKTSDFFVFIMRVCSKLKITYANKLTEALFWLYVAKVRANTSHSTLVDQVEGQIALTDRFPLKHFHSMESPMDGPRLQHGFDDSFKHLIKKENLIYRTFNQPDRIFVLQVDIDELRRRKTDLPLDDHIIKANAVNALKGNEDNITLINANKPYDEVLLELKRRIWSEL
jgi:thymidylate kinase